MSTLRVLAGAVAAAGLGLVAIAIGAVAVVAQLPADLHDVFRGVDDDPDVAP